MPCVVQDHSAPDPSLARNPSSSLAIPQISARAWVARCLPSASWIITTPPRGEVTLVLGGAPAGHDAPVHDPALIAEVIAAGLAAGASRKDVARQVAAQFGLARNEAYRLVMEQS